MAYREIETGKEGKLTALLPNVSNPQLLSEEELADFGIEYFTPEAPAKPEKTLDELKVEKYNQIKAEGSAFILGTYSLPQQTSALAGFYSDEENAAIIAFTKKYFDIIRSAGSAIKAATTEEEVNAVYFRKPILDTDNITIIGETFWGE